MKKQKIEIYTDGACKDNGKVDSEGGWGFVIKFNNTTKKEIHAAGYSKITASNRMEMLAVINALNFLFKTLGESYFNYSIVIFSDSQYVVKGCNDWMFRWERNGWKKKKGELKNIDLWKELFSLSKGLDFKINWVKGHSGNEYNELCDSLATTAIEMKSDYHNAIDKE